MKSAKIRFQKSMLRTILYPTSRNIEISRDWMVFSNDEYAGVIHHVFAKPSDYHRDFGRYHAGRDSTRKCLRRAWKLCHTLHDRMDIANPRDRRHFHMFPLMEAKALVKHCLLNKVSLRWMNNHEIADLAKHCRKMELNKVCHK